jgi:uncharacterized membrane protein YgdD (TMEM256/DUF423 family)
MRKHLVLAAVVGASGVITGALGAHALKETLLVRESLSAWNTAALYHLVHAPALLATSLTIPGNPSGAAWLSRANACWVLGITLFSGSLYWLSLGGPRWLGPITPVGGVFLIAGWLCVLGTAKTMGSSVNRTGK